ncbi:MAG: hypothetical protein ABIJ45_11455 [Candidatus Zixiibacteriota bacterium]
MFKITKYLLIMTFICICSCDVSPDSEPINKDELVGEYVANYRAGILDKIIIKKNDIYIRIFESNIGSTFVDTNSWELINELGNVNRPTITFFGFVERYPIYVNCYNMSRGKINNAPHNWGTYLKKRGSNIRIERCPAKHQYYIKQNE